PLLATTNDDRRRRLDPPPRDRPPPRRPSPLTGEIKSRRNQTSRVLATRPLRTLLSIPKNLPPARSRMARGLWVVRAGGPPLLCRGLPAGRTIQQARPRVLHHLVRRARRVGGEALARARCVVQLATRWGS